MKTKLLFNASGNKKLKTFTRISVIVLLIAAVVFLLSEGLLKATETSQFNGTAGYVEESWTYKKGEEVLEEKLTVPAFRHMEKGVTYSVSVPLTYDGRNDTAPTCFFFVDHMFCRVLVDGEEVFRYMPGDVEKPDKSKSPGNVYVSAKLPKDCLGKELKIEFIPSLDHDIEYQLPNPTFGDYSTQLSRVFWEELPHNIIAILTFFLGFGCIIYSSLALSGSSYREGLFIGIFAILFGLYNITESDFDFFMLSNPYYTYVLDYLCFTLIPIFLLLFLRERMDKVQRKISLGLILLGIGVFLTEITLHFTGVTDMREFLPILHIVFASAIVISLILIATTKKNKWKKPLIFQLIPILAGMLLDALVYYMHWQLGSSDATFTAIGVILFLISELFYVWKYSIEVYEESARSRVYQEMAFIDSLTGIGNRRSFEHEKEAISKGTKEFKTLTVLSADVNNLKTTNDNFGHASGDFLIRSAANVLTNLTANCGTVYRVGGDEFIAFLYDISEEELKDRLSLMKKSISVVNEKSTVKLGLAVGLAAEGKNIEAIIEKADRAMYIDKEKSKAESL